MRRTRYAGLALAAAAALLAPAAAARAGVIYATDRFGGTVDLFTLDGGRTRFAAGLGTPANVAFTADGSVLVAAQGGGPVPGAVVRFGPDGSRSNFGADVGQPFGVAVGPDGTVFVSDASVARRVLAFAPDGIRREVVPGLSFLSPLGLAVDAAGNLFVADFNRVLRITPAGEVSVFGAAPNGAVNLAFSPAGDLFLTTGQQAIFRYTPAGAGSVFATVPGRSTGLTFDDAGNLYVVSSAPVGIGNDVIFRFAPDGARTTFATGLNATPGLAFRPAPVPEPSACLLAALGLACAGRFARRRR
jgi:glucose/arabinose dehydrogenase